MRIRGPHGAQLLILGTSLCLAAHEARACQACVEDKIAATYDWSVVAAAKRQGHTVVFTAIKGAMAPGDTSMARRMTRAIAAVPGIDTGSVRISLSPPALSFAANLQQRSADALIAASNQRLRGLHLTLTVVRIGAPAGASPSAVLP